MTRHAVVFYWHRIKYTYPCFVEYPHYYVKLAPGAYEFSYDKAEATRFEWNEACELVDELNTQSDNVITMRGLQS